MIIKNSICTTTSDQGVDDKIKVMVVDDALVIRGMISRIIEGAGDMNVVASVGDGERALSALDRHDIDVVILDIEMPRMDGLTALPKIIEKCPGIQVIMASTLTLRNAGISMKALNLGAADYVPKPTSSGVLNTASDFKKELVDKVRVLGMIGKRRRGISARSSGGRAKDIDNRQRATGQESEAGRRVNLTGVSRQADSIQLRPMTSFVPDVITIGSSTGGPQALLKMFKDLGDTIKQPILVTQHMPPTFTTILAEHLGKISGLPAAEAVDGMVIKGGHIYIAPGGYHMLVERRGVEKAIRLTQDPPENFCRPAVDPMLRSVVKAYGKRILTIILTGMGSDGCKGCQSVVDAGGLVFAQDEATSVVWGMPGAVSMAGLCSAILSIEQIGDRVKKLAIGG